MEENSLKYQFAKLRADLAPMTWKQRVDHLFTYYKWVLVAAVALGLLIHIIVSAAITANTEILLSGIGINTDLSEEGYACMTDGYFQHIGGQKGQMVQYLEGTLDTGEDMITQEMAYSTVVRVSSLLSLEELDYLLMDQAGYDYYAEETLFLDLRQVLPQEELSALTLIYQEDVPVGIDLSGTWFQETWITREDSYYLCFVYNTPRVEACREFWEFIKTGE